MAVVGDAYVRIRVTGDPKREIEENVRRVRGRDLGDKVGYDFNTGFQRGMQRRPFNLSEGFYREIKQARDRLQALIRLGFFVGPAITAVVGGIGALIGALTTLVAVLGAATPALTALLSAITAVGQAALVGVVAFRGIGEALQAGIKAEKESAGNQEAIAAALKRVEQARIRLRNIINKEQPERLAEARERALRAEESAADALISSQRALRSYNEAQKRTLRALEDLNDARERAKERIQQLRFELEGGAISEKRARLQFERARDALQRVQDLPPNSRARQEAELAFAEADLNLRRAIDRNGDLRKEEAKATREGVEGSQEVVSAKEAITNAIQAEEDAQINAARAFRDAARARAEADKAAADAAEGGRVQQEINAQISAAREQLQDALDDLARAQRGGGAVDAFKKAMEELSPAAQEFVNYLIDIRKEFRRVRDAAAEGLFPKLIPAIQNIVDIIDTVLVPLFASTGEVLGETAKSFSDTFVEAENLANLQTAWKINDRLIKNLGGALEGLLEGVLALLAAAGPLVARFGDWAEKTLKAWGATKKADAASGELTERLNRAGDVAAKLGGIIREMGIFFKELGRIIMAPGGAGEVMLDFLKNAFKGMSDFLRAGKAFDGERSLVEYFRDLTVNGIEILRWLGDLIVLFMNLGSGPGMKGFIKKLREATAVWEDTGTEIDKALIPFGEFILQFSILAKNLTESGAISAFFKVINDSLKNLNQLFESELFVRVFNFLSQLKAVVIALYTLINIGKFFGKAFAGTFIAPIGALLTAKKNMGAFVYGIEKGGGKFAPFAGKFRAFYLMIKAVALPILGVVAAVTLLVGWLIHLYNTNEDFRVAAQALFEKLLPYWETFKESVISVIDVLKTAWNDIKAPLVELYDFIVENLIEVIRRLGSNEEGGFGGLVDKIVKVFQFALSFITGIINAVIALIAGSIVTIVTFITQVAMGIKTAVGGVIDFFAGSFQLLKTLIFGPIKLGFELVRALFTRDTTKLKETWDGFTGDLVASIKRALTGIVNIGLGVLQVFLGVAVGFLNIIITVINAGFELIKSIARFWNSTIGSINIDLPKWLGGGNISFGKIPESFMSFKIPYINIPNEIKAGAFALAKGGIVPAVGGGTLALLGEGGARERVEPLDPSGLSKRDRAMIGMLARQSGMGATIHVYPSPGMNERELANLVSRRLAYEMRTGAA